MIIDSPPALTVTDASIIAQRATGVLFVVASARTSVRAARSGHRRAAARRRPRARCRHEPGRRGAPAASILLPMPRQTISPRWTRGAVSHRRQLPPASSAEECNGGRDDAPIAVAPVPMSGPDITDLEVSSVAAVLASGCLSIGPQLEEFERQIARPDRRAARHRCIQRDGRPAPGGHCRRRRSRRPRHHDALLVRGVGKLRPVRTRDTGVRRRRSGNRQHRPGAGRAGRSRSAEPAALRVGDGFHRHFGRQRRREWDDSRRFFPFTRSVSQPTWTHSSKVARSHDLTLIEDACEAIGATYKEQHAGAIGDVGVFAFYPEQATDDRRRRHDRDEQGRLGGAIPVAPESGPRQDGCVAPARSPRLQLPDERAERGTGCRAALAIRRICSRRAIASPARIPSACHGLPWLQVPPVVVEHDSDVVVRLRCAACGRHRSQNA